MRVASLIGLIVALPMAFIVVMTQANGLQNTARGLVPTAIDPVFGPVTWLILIISLVIATFTVIAAGMLIFGDR